ncbi:MAG: SPOR domain-containing protein [Gemmatimonadota bacterium]|nr:SPOR domain-containing protein [Gemmatimonadota bacterium]
MRIISTLVIAAASTLALTAAAHAQAPGEDDARSRAVRQAGTPSTAPSPSANDSLFRRAERLVREGRGEAGRALVDTLLAGTRPGSAEHAQALYWRASLAGDAADAERGYRRVIVEYPATRWAGDALLNLAQLELARGDQERALVHLYRFEREYPSHESRARAAFWLARLRFDTKNEPRGCAALATARAAASPEDVELRNQIDYYAQRCIGVDTAAGAPAPHSEPAPSSPQRIAARDSQHVVPLASDSGARAPAGAGGYTVQVAAYGTRPAAEALIERLKARGYTARLASSSPPFRVRVGRYDTRAEAVAAQQRLKAKGIEGFVTETEK